VRHVMSLAHAVPPAGVHFGAVVSRSGRKRQRRRQETFIVALARKLLIAFWRFLKYGEAPEGMRLANV
jgi:hypothetical protein